VSIFLIFEANVVLYNITFINGHSTQDGGAIEVVPGSSVKIFNCTFINNSAENSGGAIYANNAAIATDCIFINNCAKDGAAIYECEANGCNFTKNHASHGGGAIHSSNAINCIFTENEAQQYGGAMYESYAEKCNFTKNRAIDGFGDAMYRGTSVLCIFETSSQSTTDTDIQPKFNVYSTTFKYGSGEKLFFNLCYDNKVYDGYNATITITQDSQEIGVYHALSGIDRGWAVDLDVGTYDATLSLEPYAVEPLSVGITVKDATSFWDLNNTINGNTESEITLNKNYSFDSDFDTQFVNGITIGRELTLNNLAL
jgi:predicted outer membrane repeat protein